MHRIDNATAIPALPAPEPIGTPGFFTNGNRPTGLVPTRVDDAWLNTVQEEIATVVLGAGMALSKTSNTQLYEAIQAIAYGANPDLSAYLPLAGGTMNLVVPFTINTLAIGGVTITANAGVNAGLAILTPIGGNNSAQISFTVGGRSYQTGVSGAGVFVINDISPPIPNPGLVRLSIDTNGEVSINNALTVGATLNVGGGIIMGTGGQAGLIVYGSALKTPPAVWEALETGVEQIVLDPYTHGLDVIRQLDPVNCRYVVAPPYNNDEREAEIHPGLTRANIAAVLPEMLRSQTVQLHSDSDADPELVETISYHALTYVLINAVKQLADRLDALEGGEPAAPLPA